MMNLQKGFTLVETMVAIGIITAALVGILGLLASSIPLGKEIRDNHIAANLSQEGIEVIHNLRHTNWVLQQSVPGTDWDAGLTDGVACVNYNSTALITPCAPSSLLFDETTDRYNHSVGTATDFSRTITISHETDADTIGFMRILSIVTWGTNTIITEEHLYDWK